MEREPIEIEDGEDSICPECQAKLDPFKAGGGRSLPKWAIPAVAALCLIGLALWFALRPAKPVVTRTQTAPGPGLSSGAQNRPVPTSPGNAGGCTDSQMAAALKERLGHEEDLKATPIQVDVTKGTVILSGTVESDLARNYAADLAQRIGCPVASVVNDLKVGPSDKVIAARIHVAFAKNMALRGAPVLIEVSHGNVILSGSVSENLARTVAASIASQVAGVGTVTNNLVIHAIPVTPLTQASGSEKIPDSMPSRAQRDLTGTWIGSYLTCAQGQTQIRMQISEPTPDDVTASVEIAMPGAPSASFVAHGILNTMNGFLALQFNGWQHQPPGFTMGNIGGYVTYREGNPQQFSAIVRSPGCGHIDVKRQ